MFGVVLLFIVDVISAKGSSLGAEETMAMIW
jgi:hypothetical protein